MTAFIPPRRPTNQVPPPTSPVAPSSLAGTMQGLNVAMPPPVPVQGMPGVQIPQDYAGTLQSGAFEAEETPIPGKGSQAIDMILSSLGGLLGGQGLAGVAGGILGVRENIEAIKAENQKAREKARMDKINFITKGMEQSRADRQQVAQRVLDDARREGDVQAVKQAQAQLDVEKERMGADKQRFEAEQALAAAEIERARTELANKQNPDREDALQLLEDYQGNLRMVRQKLAESMSRGDAVPTIEVPGSVEGEMITLSGDHIRRTLEDELELAVNQFAAYGEDEGQQARLGEAARAAFESTILPALDEWTARNAIRLREEARKAEAQATKLRKRNERVGRNQARAKAGLRKVTNLFPVRKAKEVTQGGGF